MLARDDRVKRLADAVVVWVSTQAEAQARPASQGSLRLLDYRLDLRAVDDVSKGVGSWPQALKGIGNGLPDPAAGLGQCIG